LQVSNELQEEGHFSSNAHYASCGLSFSCMRSTRHLVDKYAPLLQFVAQAVDHLLKCERVGGGGGGGGGSSSSSISSSIKNSDLDHLKAE
jgi:hypothetical protein